MKRLRSDAVPTALSMGAQKLGQPVPLSNFVSDEKSGRSPVAGLQPRDVPSPQFREREKCAKTSSGDDHWVH